MSDEPAKPKPFYYGGQAILEGVMMRGQEAWSLAVRRPKGEIYLEQHALRPLASRVRLFKLPFFRGIGVLGDSLAIGVKALAISGNQALDQVEDQVVGEPAGQPVGPGRRGEDEQGREEGGADPQRPAHLLVGQLLFLFEGLVAGDGQRLDADGQRVDQHAHAAEERQLEQPGPGGQRPQAVLLEVDLALGPADSQRPGLLAAHHHAFQDGLAAVVERLLLAGLVAHVAPPAQAVDSGALRLP